MTTITHNYPTLAHYIAFLRGMADQRKHMAEHATTRVAARAWQAEAKAYAQVADDLEGTSDTRIAEIHGERQ